MNGGDLFLTVFSYAVGILLLWANIKEYKEYNNALQMELKRKNYECYDYSKGLKAIYIVFAAAGISFAIYGYFAADYTTSAIGVVTFFLFIGQTLLTSKKYRMHYDDEAFLLAGDRVNYKTISDIKEIRFLPFAFKRITALNGKEYRVSNGCLKIIDQKNLERREKKKEGKKKQTVH
jgi:hypothetical protein